MALPVWIGPAISVLSKVIGWASNRWGKVMSIRKRRHLAAEREVYRAQDAETTRGDVVRSSDDELLEQLGRHNRGGNSRDN